MNNTPAAGASTAGNAPKTKARTAPTPGAAAEKDSVAKPRRKQASATTAPATPKLSSIKTPRVSKKDHLAGLLIRAEGATLDQMIEATCWLPHTTRAALTGLRKKGYVIDSDKVDGVRTDKGLLYDGATFGSLKRDRDHHHGHPLVRGTLLRTER
jgi:hypothetical protein